MTAAQYRRGRVVKWDGETSRATIRPDEGGPDVDARGAYFNGFSISVHAGLRVEFALIETDSGPRLLDVRPVLTT